MKHAKQTDWRAVAGALASLIPRTRLDQSVLAWTDDRAASRKPWHVALSGGGDSVALLLLVWAHWPKRRRLLCALHFDHRLRGAASRADAIFCRDLCEQLKVKLVTGEWVNRSVPDKAARARSGSPRSYPISEAAARTARMAFFEGHSKVLWLGHQQDDVAETMLMRLARGSGAGGLSAPRPVQILPGARVHLRPLLTLKKQEILEALRSAKGIWREDATNEGDDYFRNRIRGRIVPAWVYASQRDAIAGAARSRELLAEDDAALEQWLGELAPFSKSGDILLNRLAGKPRALLRRALHVWLIKCPQKIDLSRQAFDSLLTAMERAAPTRHSIGRELFAVVQGGRLKRVFGKR